MAIITININDSIEKEFRETVREKLGEGKGILGRAIEESLKKWLHDERQKEIAKRAMEMVDKGIYSLKGWKFNRDEIYERGL